MALKILRKPKECILDLKDPETGLYPINHIFEPEFHQEKYVSVVKDLSVIKNSFQIGTCNSLIEYPHRGIQPKYADDENDPESLEWEGMVKIDGKILSKKENKDLNVCALKSVCVRFGYIDFETARSVSQDFYESKKAKAGIKKNDVLVNSTGDGTIGRVAVFNYDFPALVDGHIAILRFDDEKLAWYIAAFLLSDYGQKQIYRYINGSSGQVEIYPQDIARIWIRSESKKKITTIAEKLKAACEKHEQFQRDLKIALNLVNN